MASGCCVTRSPLWSFALHSGARGCLGGPGARASARLCTSSRGRGGGEAVITRRPLGALRPTKVARLSSWLLAPLLITALLITDYFWSLSPRVKLGGSLAGNDSSSASSTSCSKWRSWSLPLFSSGRFALMVSPQLIFIFFRFNRFAFLLKGQTALV